MILVQPFSLPFAQYKPPSYYIQLLKEANNTFTTFSYDNFLELEWFYKQKTGSYFTHEQKKAMFDLEGFVMSEAWCMRETRKPIRRVPLSE
jgi:hypothetical protein